MTDNDDWHAGYREGLRDGRNISTELAPSQEVPAGSTPGWCPIGCADQPQCAEVTDEMLAISGLNKDWNRLRSALVEIMGEVGTSTKAHKIAREALGETPSQPLSGNPPQCAREAIAKTIAAWIGYSYDDLDDNSVVDRGFPEWADIGTYQGGRRDLLRLADALMALETANKEN